MSGPEVVFAFAGGQNVYYRELAEALRFELDQLGVSSRLAVNELPAPVAGRVVVLVSPSEFAQFGGVTLAPALLRRCILLSAEQPGSDSFAANAELGRGAGGLFDLHAPAVAAYRAAGVAAEHLRLGYSAAWDGREEGLGRDIDILFIGRSSERRERALARYADLFDRFRCELVLADPSIPHAHEGPDFVAGGSKRRLLARSKVLLNLHAEDGAGFEWLRAAEAISSGCAIASEQAAGLEPLRPGVDLFTGDAEALPYLATWLAEDEVHRTQVAGEAEASLRATPLADAAATLLEAARKVAAVDAAPQVEAQAQVAQVLLSSVPLLAPRPVPAGPVEEPPAPGNLRLRPAIEAATPAWREAARPVVSAVLPFDDAAAALAALESLRRSTISAWEAVLVGAAEGESGDVLRDWMSRHPDLRACLVRPAGNGGAAARNAGVARSRGDLVLMLDSDSRLRPSGIARLVAALVGDPGADFAYGLLDRGAGEGGGVANRFGWDLQRLAAESYIELPAMIRRRALFELGGYSEDPRLEPGREDHDLWLRMARERRRAIFVRELVGSRRVTALLAAQ